MIIMKYTFLHAFHTVQLNPDKSTILNKYVNPIIKSYKKLNEINEYRFRNSGYNDEEQESNSING